MNKNEIDVFYDQYVDGNFSNGDNFLGHFNFLSWKNLQKDLPACERLQRKPFYKIALLQGKANYYFNDKQISISGNTIAITDPMTRSRFKTTDPNFSGRYCVCTESFLRGTGRLSLINWPIFKDRNVYAESLMDNQYEDLKRIFDDIEYEYTSNYPFKEQFIQHKVLEIIHYIQKSNKNLDTFTSTRNNSLEQLFFKALDDAFYNISMEKPLADKSPVYFAKSLHTSVDLLNKAMKTLTLKTTQALIHDRIIEEANILLKHSQYSMKEIAWCLHFKETSHFQNFYKKHMKRTPLEYRLA